LGPLWPSEIYINYLDQGGYRGVGIWRIKKKEKKREKAINKRL